MSNNNSKNNQVRQAKVNINKPANRTTNNQEKQALQNKNETNKNLKNIQNSAVKQEPKTVIKNNSQSSTKQDLVHFNNENSPNKMKKQNKKKNIISACIIFGVTFIAAILGTALGGKMVEGRTNPPAYPPDWVFTVAWAILYVLISLATFIFYKNNHDTKKRNCALIWYSIHLFFNLFWPLFYFRLDMLIVSCFILLAMVITAIVLTFKYFRNNLISGWLFTAYTLWLLYAMYLNLSITLLNIS